MFGILLAIHVLVTILLILVILIQKSEGGSSLFASGSGNSMFSARGTSNMLTKATWVLATIFLLNCILMAHISAVNVKRANSLITSKTISKMASQKHASKSSQQKDNKNNQQTTNVDKSKNSTKNKK